MDRMCGYCSRIRKKGFHAGMIFYQRACTDGDLLYLCSETLRDVRADSKCHCGKFRKSKRKHPMPMRMLYAEFFVSRPGNTRG